MTVYTPVSGEITAQGINDIASALDSGKLDKDGGSPTNIGMFNLNDATTLTIASGAITVTQSYHNVDTEGGAATDDLTTINGGSAGDILVLRALSGSRQTTIKSGVGNIASFDNTDVSLSSSASSVLLFFTGVSWVVVGIQGVKRSGDDMTGPLKMKRPSESFKFGTGSDATTYADFDFPDVSTANVVVRFFRVTNTSGIRYIYICKGDGSGLTTYLFDAATGITTLANGTTHGEITGSPEGVVAAKVGSTRYRLDGGATTTFYVKTSGTGNTGWTAK